MKEFWGIPLIVWLTISVVIAIIYLFVPKKIPNEGISTFQRSILRYSHTVVWLLLALTCLLNIYNLNGFAKAVSLLAIIVYIIFILNFLRFRLKEKKRQTMKKKRH